MSGYDKYALCKVIDAAETVEAYLFDTPNAKDLIKEYDIFDVRYALKDLAKGLKAAVDDKNEQEEEKC